MKLAKLAKRVREISNIISSINNLRTLVIEVHKILDNCSPFFMRYIMNKMRVPQDEINE